MWRQQRIQKRKKTKTHHSTVPNPPCTVPAQRGPSASAKSKIHIDYRTVGVRQVKSGRWEVKFLYQGSVRCFSTYDTQAHAALANEAARSFLLATRCVKLTVEEIKDNIQAAKAKAFAAAPDSRPIQKGPVLSVNRTKAPMDYRTVGVRQVKSGKFEVTIGYQGKTRCCMGTYQTQDQAALANEAARTFLLATRCANLTAEEIKDNVQAAKAAAKAAVAKASQEDQACSSASQEKNVEDDDEETRPKLTPSNLQSKESIEAWLEDRKRRWQSLRVQKSLTKPDHSAAAKKITYPTPTPSQLQQSASEEEVTSCTTEAELDNEHQDNDELRSRINVKAGELEERSLLEDEREGWVGAYSPMSRHLRVNRFLEKRNQRTWTKKVKYNVRKDFADSRLRVKGRFVKQEDEMLMRELVSLT